MKAPRPFEPARTLPSRTLRGRYLAAPIFAALLAACGGSAAIDSGAAPEPISETTTDAAESGASAENAAAANIPNLQSAEVVFDVEVLSVADGSVSSLREVVTGDRPVLVWFWAPH